MSEPTAVPWWGRFEVPEGQGGHWRTGTLDLWLRRREREWRMARLSVPEAPDLPPVVECPLAAIELPEGAEVQRFASRTTSPDLHLAPLLADRSVVTRPEVPFHLLGGDEITFYVSTPVWVRIAVGDPQRILFELPALRPPDTWFGPSTMIGELAYASRTAARLHLENLPRRPYRAITRVELHNEAASDMLLERLNLPAPSLALWADADASLWTSDVRVVREPDGRMARVDVGEGPPSEARRAERLSAPRVRGTRHSLVRALGALLG